MYSFEVNVRVRYAETDQMGYCYYGNYAQYFEVARVEALRNLGVSYKTMEERGVMLPVTEYSIKYLKPAFYDENLTIRAIIRTQPNVRIHFDYQTINETGELINEATTQLVFLNKETMKPTRAPQELTDQLKRYFVD